MKKVLISLVLILALLGSVFAGGQQDAAADKVEDDGVLKAALLTSGPINDGGWNTFAYDGLTELKEKLGYEIANTENVQQSAQKSIIRNYAKKGFDLIIGHGFEYGEALMEVAKEFPDITFFQVGGDALGPNVGSGMFESETLAYLVAQVAAKFTKTNKIGFVGAMEIPTIAMEVEMIKKTVPLFNPAATVTVAYTGSWTDVNKGKEAALAQIANGVDVIIAIGDACDIGAIKAAEEKGTYVIGWVGDFNNLSPDVVITSGVQSVPFIIVEQGKALAEGKWKAESKIWGIKDGALYLGTFADIVPQDIIDAAMADQEKIKKGELDVSKL